MGIMQFNKNATDRAKEDVKTALKTLNDHLLTRTLPSFLVRVGRRKARRKHQRRRRKRNQRRRKKRRLNQKQISLLSQKRKIPLMRYRKELLIWRNGRDSIPIMTRILLSLGSGNILTTRTTLFGRETTSTTMSCPWSSCPVTSLVVCSSAWRN